MPQVVNTNIPSLFTQRQLNKTGSALETSLQRLSSGLRINSAKDDAAGLAISTRFSAQIKGLDMAARNANDGISLAQTAEGGLEEMTSNLQRLRELSVQASNGSLSSADRASLNDEAKQLIDEMGRISDTTHFNGIKLLDGSAQDLTLQIGANAHENFKFSIDGARTDQLGVMQTTSLSSMTRYAGATETLLTDDALQQGDLVINGVTVGASLVSYDTASTVDKDASAIAKAQAINLQSTETGVTAQVNETRSEGSTMTAGGGSSTGTLAINGVTVNVTAVANDNASTRVAVVNAINAKSGQTGVVASDTGDDNKGVELVAADGRNIEVSMGTATSALTGIKADVTYGTYTLSSDKTITLEEGINGRIERSGLQAGAYEKGIATLTSSENNGLALAADDFTINGVRIGATLATDDAASTTTAATGDGSIASGIAKAAAINRISDQTGVTATADTNTVRGSTMTGAGVTGTITINGISTANFATTTDMAHSRAVTVVAINEISAQTGVYAVDTGADGTGVELIAADGRNIDVTLTGVTSASTGVTGGANYGGYTLHSSKAITIGAGSTGNEENGGFSLGIFGIGESGTAIEDVDISTVDGAQAAISAVDNALESINSNRSNLGAVQNRLTSSISQLASASENFSASRSRILDADFAKETVALTKAQVMQQAGVAMLAQAKALPQQVMSLLQG